MCCKHETLSVVVVITYCTCESCITHNAEHTCRGTVGVEWLSVLLLHITILKYSSIYPSLTVCKTVPDSPVSHYFLLKWEISVFNICFSHCDLQWIHHSARKDFFFDGQDEIYFKVFLLISNWRCDELKTRIWFGLKPTTQKLTFILTHSFQFTLLNNPIVTVQATDSHTCSPYALNTDMVMSVRNISSALWFLFSRLVKTKPCFLLDETKTYCLRETASGSRHETAALHTPLKLCYWGRVTLSSSGAVGFHFSFAERGVKTSPIVSDPTFYFMLIWPSPQIQIGFVKRVRERPWNFPNPQILDPSCENLTCKLFYLFIFCSSF